MNNNEQIKIGGEFEIYTNAFAAYAHAGPLQRNDFFSSGRSALMAILSQLDQSVARTIHVPFYICDSVVNACTQVGYKIYFYELDENFCFPLRYAEQVGKKEVVLTVNYFGFINDNNVIADIKAARQDVTIISDHVQSFWTLTESLADYAFTSLRKHFPVPDGALIYSKHAQVTNASLPQSEFYKNKLIGSLLKSQNLPDTVFLKFLKEGEDDLDNETEISRGSDLSAFLFDSLDTEKHKEQRVQNYELAYHLGAECGIEFVFPFDATVIPMHVPVLVNNRDAVRQALIQENIFLPIHWPVSDFNSKSAMAAKMSSNELSIVIDPRYNEAQIEHEIKSLVKAINHV